MNLFLYFMFIFFIGSMLGYVLEVLFRRIVYKSKINPGFLVGPYLPIYGFGLCTLSLLYFLLNQFNLNPILIIVMMGLSMTLIELIGGLIFVKGHGVKLWDYSNLKWNYKGIICPQFTIIWTILGAIYYYFIVDKVIIALNWFSNNIAFSYVLGIFTGVIVIDYIYATNTLVKIRRFAKNNNFIIKYEEFKSHIKNIQVKNNNKYSFLFPFKQTESLIKCLKMYYNKKK